MSQNDIILSEDISIKSKIYFIRESYVMLDKDIAALYGVEPIRLREQVKRNRERFPIDFMFQLNDREIDFLLSQNAIPSRKALGGSLPYVFTEQGVASLSGVLKSKQASEVHVNIMRSFVEMRRYIQSNLGLPSKVESLEKRQNTFEYETEKKFEKVFKALESSELPKQGIFYDGQVFDAYIFTSDIIRSSKKSIVLIDSYIDEKVLMLLDKRADNVKATVYTSHITKSLAQDIKVHNQQYPAIELKEFKDAHDRFMIIDENTIYHIGASLKDLGKKWFAFSKMEAGAIEMLKKLGYGEGANE